MDRCTGARAWRRDAAGSARPRELSVRDLAARHASVRLRACAAAAVFAARRQQYASEAVAAHVPAQPDHRSEARTVGKEWVKTGRHRVTPVNYTKNNKKNT